MFGGDEVAGEARGQQGLHHLRVRSAPVLRLVGVAGGDLGDPVGVLGDSGTGHALGTRRERGGLPTAVSSRTCGLSGGLSSILDASLSA